jgi:tRNA pseudouridine13 synthase
MAGDGSPSEGLEGSPSEGLEGSPSEGLEGTGQASGNEAGYRLKQVPEDFLVREVLDVEARVREGGRFAYYLLRKRGYTTQRAVELAARAFGKRLRYVNFAGNKDKDAVTEQYVTILHGPARDLQLDGVSLKYVGQGRERLNLGSAEGNEFEITVRGLDPGRLDGWDGKAMPLIPNYFDAQRFGARMDNHLVGRLLVKRDFEAAAGMIPECGEWLSRNPNDFVGSLRSLPKRVLRIYAHAYQSWLWNQAASGYLSGFEHRMVRTPMGRLAFPLEPVPEMSVPLVGYETPPGKDAVWDIAREILEREGVRLEDFRLRQFPEFDLKGDERSLLADVMGFRAGTPEEDELNPGKSKASLRFALPPGSYATMVVRGLFG